MSELFRNYRKKHPDLCPYLPECKTWTKTQCHQHSHKNCEVYKKKVEEEP